MISTWFSSTEMVRFSCFNAHIHSSKPKKTVQLSAEFMHKALEDRSDNQRLKDFANSSSGNPLHLKAQKVTTCITSDQVTTSSSIEHDCKSEEIKTKYSAESDAEVHKTHMKKSQSLGSGLDQMGRVFGGNDLRDETDQGFSGDGSQGQSGSVISVGEKEPEVSLSDQCPRALRSVSVQVSSDMVNNESIFSIGDAQQSEKGDCRENSDTQFSGEGSNHTPRTPRTQHVIAKSCSLPNIVSYGGHSHTESIMPRATSCEDLNVLELNRKEILVPKVGTQVNQDDEGYDSVKSNERTNMGNPADDGYEGYNYVGTAKDWIIPVMDEVNSLKIPRPESAIYHWEDLPSKDFKIKRIEEWVMDLQHCSPLDEKYELSASTDHLADARVTVLDSLPAARHDGKITPGMEAAKRYISSLSATATSAQLANHGLVMIPFLSAFVSLKALNLSGNAIVRITAGALPRGLHILNLSKNNITTIEGLRELTRLRVLDLSYNRILRIGHGLASCSSLKELYLAGNKISEVEGLHRLLKLNVLDLRFNKISTTKCLGQLAANYNSLQAISLEGNPAQKNVGDEQLKKYLQGLLPNLAYFNRQSIKAGTLKDSADRSTRLGISAHQIDRGHKSAPKTMRKENHGVTAHKRPSSSIHGRRSQQPMAAPKPSRDRHGRLPPSGIKTIVRHSFYDFGSKQLNFRPDLAMHRSRSEGTLGGL